MGTGAGNIDYTKSEFQNQLTYARPQNGADVQIETWGETSIDARTPIYGDFGRTIRHLDKYGVRSTPKVVSHKQGIRVGCTFVTNAALEELYRLHKKFLKIEDTKVHQ